MTEHGDGGSAPAGDPGPAQSAEARARAAVSAATARERDGDGQSGDASFSGKRGTVFWMQLRFMLLTLFTLGIYRFWAKTKTRRYFWSHAEIGGDRLEYLGTAKELLIGFLIALAVLIPLYLLSTTAETLFVTSPETAGVMATLAGIGIVLFIQVALYRMWRYRLTRTAWRGIRFGMDGSTAKFVLMSMLYLLLTIVTLGLAAPWMRVALARYRINHARFGDRHFTCDAAGGSMFLPWLVVYLTAGLGYIWYAVREFNTVLGRTRFGDSTISVRVRSLPLYGWAVLMVGTLALCFAFLLAATGLVAVFATESVSAEVAMAPVMATWVVGGLIVVLLFAVMLVSFILFEVAKQACNTLEIGAIGVFEEAAQSAAQQPAYGEGFADALDVGAI